MFLSRSASNLSSLLSLTKSGSTSTLVQDSLLFTTDEVEKLSNRFSHLDKKERGYITHQELRGLPELAANPLGNRIVSCLFAAAKTPAADRMSTPGQITFGEFLEFMAPFSSRSRREDKLAFAFKIYDVDGDGFISRADLYYILKAMTGSSLQDSLVTKLVNDTIIEYDVDQDDALSYLEFKRAMFDSDIEQILCISF
ncbi:Calcineurin subunit B [Kappamyces sp. JEL0829]|nr:Calcineurin subunit B [Kappamyces sp. JEL0829]